MMIPIATEQRLPFALLVPNESELPSLRSYWLTFPSCKPPKKPSEERFYILFADPTIECRFDYQEG